ncbi:MAG: hypothetical protein R2874_01430 [Desulfobacterales bacterium]
MLEHRGPDDSRTERYATGGRSVGLGFVRLSILDFETGMQPIKCDADDTAILCNGQIYNYIELKKVVADAPFISKEIWRWRCIYTAPKELIFSHT